MEKNYWISKLNRTYILLLFSLISTAGNAQYQDLQGYYQFPIRPGLQNYLSGSMGELRSTHFHGGIDIKTSGVSGLPVYAAADGYVSRIKVTTGGYGHALYIKHPNGTTTVYAHLQELNEPLQRYLIRRQYNSKSFTVDLFPGKSEFPIKKGEIIALSGNTGSSSGPHLHFEIRDANQYVLDPLKVGFSEIKDDLSPVLIQVAFVTLSPNSRVNGQFGRFEFNVVNTGSNQFGLSQPIQLSGEIGMEVYAYDKANDTRNRYGIPDLTASLNEKIFFSQKIRNIPYGKMRNILVHTNYQNSVRGGRRFNKLYKSDGNTLGFYDQVARNGVLTISPDQEARFKIEMKDPFGNESVFDFTANKGLPPTAVADANGRVITRQLEVMGNTLKIFVPDRGDSHLLELFANNHSYQLPPDYVTKDGSHYLWDLCYGLPDSVDFCTEVKRIDYSQSFFPKQRASFYHPTTSVSFSESTLFDTLHLRYRYRYDSLEMRELFSFKNTEDPLRGNAKITLKPQCEYDQRYARVYTYYGNGKTAFAGGNWSDNQISFSTRDLIGYTIDYDSVSPSIKPGKIGSQQIRLTIDDDKSGIQSYSAQLNGKWLLLKYDYKRNLLQTDPLDPNIPFTGELLVEVKDNTGNTSQYKTKIN